MSYRGPRSIMVDSRSTDGRYLGRASVATRSIIGDDSVDWQSSYRPRWLSADIDSNTSTLHRPTDASTDTLPILDRRFTDVLPTHCRCYRDRLSVDLSTEGDPMIGRYIANIAADARSTLARYSTDNRPILGRYIDPDIDNQSTDIPTVTIDRGPL